MKKITNFIVEKRYFILTTFLLLAGISAFLSTKVKINYDITEYLPSSSEIRKGIDIMNEEFSNTTSSFNIMFKDLTDTEKEETYDYLKKIDGVNSITYQNNTSYNKDGYTMYIVSIDGESDSKNAKEVFSTIIEHYEDKEVYTSGEVAERNGDVVSLSIICIAIACAMVILIIMCESYIEPFLFLFSILIGVLLNKGTNIFFSNVSNITDSICAILQMALSMDYSIMLMNRYIQENEKEKDKVKAMKTALYNAFKSISSSSVTTIVGLIALVFMSFTIGRDLGLVLAKGVLFSLLSIFTCLPALILISDKLIKKTKKKSPVIHLDKLGKIAYKGRYIAIFLFVLAFIGSYLLKGNLTILYTNSEEDKINEIFEENNQMAVVYKNEYEDIINNYCQKLEANEKVKEVLCYSNTINQKLLYNELNTKLNDLGIDTKIDDELLKLVYYYYKNPKRNEKTTTTDFINFIENTIYKSENIKDSIDSKTKDNIALLKNFVLPESINKKRNIKELSEIFGIEEESLKNILLLYQSENITTKITLTDFITFMNKVVLKDSTYSNNIRSSAKENLKTLSKLANKKTLTQKFNSKEMANILGIDENNSNLLYTYYILNQSLDTKISINEFANFVKNIVMKDETFKNLFTPEIQEKINLLATFSNEDLITEKKNSLTLSKIFNLDEDIIKQIMFLYYTNNESNSTYKIKEFVMQLEYLKNNTNYLDNVDISGILTLKNNSILINSEVDYKSSELDELLNIPKEKVYYLYALLDYANNNTASWNITPYELVNTIINNQDNPLLANSLNSSTIYTLHLLSNIMNSAINKATYSYQEMASFLNMDENMMKSIYSMYKNNKEIITLTIPELLDFVIKHQKDEAIKNTLTTSMIEKISLLSNICNGILNNKTYSPNDLNKLLGIDTNNLKLIYALYDVKVLNKEITISINDFVSFIKESVLTNKAFANSFDDTSKNKINTIKDLINISLNNEKLNHDELYNYLKQLSDDLNNNIIDLSYLYYGSINNYDNDVALTIEEVVNFLNYDILNNNQFKDLLNEEIREKITSSKELINNAKDMLVGKEYSRMIINTTFASESTETFDFIKDIKNNLQNNNQDIYVIGDSPMALEMSNSFDSELNFITILTMLFIFVVVALTFKSILIPFLLVLLIQCAVYLTMGILSFSGGTVYFIALLIVQSILMGATIDYAILYTSYYLEHRKTMGKIESVIASLNKSIHTILTSASILTIVTLVVGYFASAIAAKICKTISEGTLCSTILIIFLLPAVLVALDKFIIKKKK